MSASCHTCRSKSVFHFRELWSFPLEPISLTRFSTTLCLQTHTRVLQLPETLSRLDNRLYISRRKKAKVYFCSPFMVTISRHVKCEMPLVFLKDGNSRDNYIHKEGYFPLLCLCNLLFNIECTYWKRKIAVTHLTRVLETSRTDQRLRWKTVTDT